MAGATADAGRSPIDRVLGVGAPVVAGSLLLAHAAYWWLIQGSSWGGDYQGTADQYAEGLRDPWFWSLELAFVVAGALVAVGVLARGVVRRDRVLLAGGGLGLVAVGQMVALRLLLPTPEETGLPGPTDDEFGGTPYPAIDSLNGSIQRSAALAVLLFVVALAIGRTLLSAPIPEHP